MMTECLFLIEDNNLTNYMLSYITSLFGVQAASLQYSEVTGKSQNFESSCKFRKINPTISTIITV